MAAVADTREGRDDASTPLSERFEACIVLSGVGAWHGALAWWSTLPISALTTPPPQGTPWDTVAGIGSFVWRVLKSSAAACP